jgi:hypothetical protein
MGTQVITFKVGKRMFTHEFLIAPLDAEYTGVLGVDVLRHMEASVDLRTSTLVLGRKRYQLSGQEVERCSLIRRQCRRLQEASEPGLINPEKERTDGQDEVPIPGLSSGGTDSDCWNVVALGSVVLPPLSEGLVIGKIEKPNGVDLPREVLIEPLGLGTPGAYVARVASRVLTSEELEELKDREKGCLGRENRNSGTREQVDSDHRARGNSARYCVLKVLNTRGQSLEVGKNVPLGQAEPLRWIPPVDTGVDLRNPGATGTPDLQISSLSGRNPRELIEKRKQLEGKLEHLSSGEKQILMPIIEEYFDLFCNEDTGVLPSTTRGCHEIRTGDALPIKKNPYRVPYALREEMKRQLDEMLAKGVITPCASPWAAPVILVPKKSLDGTPRYRFCTDFRGLNSVTITPVYPIPDIKSKLSLMQEVDILLCWILRMPTGRFLSGREIGI